VDIYKDTIAVGAWSADGVTSNTGNVTIFERSAGVWTETQVIQVADGKSTDFFGRSLPTMARLGNNKPS